MLQQRVEQGVNECEAKWATELDRRLAQNDSAWQQRLAQLAQEKGLQADRLAAQKVEEPVDAQLENEEVNDAWINNLVQELEQAQERSAELEQQVRRQ